MAVLLERGGQLAQGRLVLLPEASQQHVTNTDIANTYATHLGDGSG